MSNERYIQLRLEVSEEVHHWLKAIQEQIQLEQHRKLSLADIAEVKLGELARKEHNHANDRQT